MQSYLDTRSMVDSFTILNCEHKRLFWRLIGHTAMIYRDPGTDVVYVYESTQMGDANGVRLVPFGEWLAKYPGKVYARVCMIRGRRPGCEHNNLLRDHIRIYRGTSYPDLKTWKWRWHMVNAALDLPGSQPSLENVDQDKVMHCTMHTGHTFRFCKLTNPHGWGMFGDDLFNPAEFEPDDTRDGGQFERYLKSYVTLLKEVRIK